MPSSSRLLGRLLLVAGSGAVACGARSEPLDTTPPLPDVSSAGQSGSGQSGQDSGGQAGAGQGGTSQGGANQGGTSQGGTSPQGGAAGNQGTTHCYQVSLAGDPAPPSTCSAITDPNLPGKLTSFTPPGNCYYVSAVLSGPVETIEGTTLSCCYQTLGTTNFCGTGRPFWVGSGARQASLERGAGASDRGAALGAGGVTAGWA